MKGSKYRNHLLLIVKDFKLELGKQFSKQQAVIRLMKQLTNDTKFKNLNLAISGTE